MDAPDNARHLLIQMIRRDIFLIQLEAAPVTNSAVALARWTADYNINRPHDIQHLRRRECTYVACDSVSMWMIRSKCLDAIPKQIDAAYRDEALGLLEAER